jgi:hypothetical protein
MWDGAQIQDEVPVLVGEPGPVMELELPVEPEDVLATRELEEGMLRQERRPLTINGEVVRLFKRVITHKK